MRLHVKIALVVCCMVQIMDGSQRGTRLNQSSVVTAHQRKSRNFHNSWVIKQEDYRKCLATILAAQLTANNVDHNVPSPSPIKPKELSDDESNGTVSGTSSPEPEEKSFDDSWNQSRKDSFYGSPRRCISPSASKNSLDGLVVVESPKSVVGSGYREHSVPTPKKNHAHDVKSPSPVGKK